jgi:hypothetical protein
MDYSGSKFRCFLVFLLVFNSVVFASKATIDAEAVAGTNLYNSLNAFLQYYNTNASATMPDTVLFTHADVDTFLMSNYIGNRAPTGGMLFIGECDNPDSFPVINHTGSENYYNFFLGKIAFEKIHFTGNCAFRSASSVNIVTFRRCVIKEYSSFFITLESSSPTQNLFENCLIVNNKYASGVIDLNSYGAGKKIAFVNCTFDNNTKLFNVTANNVDSAIVFRNSIFSGSTTYFPSSKMKSNATFCLTSDSDLTGYGSDCVSGSPKYTATGRVKPSDWKIPSNSPAAKKGTLPGAPSIDIGKRSRLLTSNDIGCWVPDVPVKPDITDEPDTVVVNEDSTVTFSVVATGVELKYAWYSFGSTTKLSDSSKFIMKAAFSDSGSKYNCIVTNDGGADTSRLAVLNVLKKPVITKDISDTTVSINDTFCLFVKASGSNISYQWYRNRSPVAATTNDTIMFNGISLENNGDTIYCVVKNILGKSISSKTIVLTVKDNEGAKIKTEPAEYLPVTMGDAFSISTEATGSGEILYVWYKNGLASTDSVGSGMVFKKASASLADSGVYRCVVNNGYGKDTTIAVTVKVMDPSQIRCRLQLTGEFIDREHVRVRVKNLKSITGVIPNPNVDTVILWCDTTDFPIKKSTNTLKFKIPMIRFTKDLDTYDTLLELQKLSDKCYSSYFIPVLSWKHPDTTLVGEKSSGAAVSMCSLEKLANPIKIDCDYIAFSDSVKVRFTKIPTGSARDSIQYLIIQYGNEGVGLINDTIRKATLPPGDSVGKVYISSDFLNDPQIITFSVKIRGILGNLSDTTSKSVNVGIDRPVNSISSLKADSIYENVVDLKWSILPTESVDSIRIWLGKTPIPLKYNPDTSKYSPITLLGNDRVHKFGNLEFNTLYYFAAQTKNGGLWSSITSTASTSAKTLNAIDTQRVANTIKINGLKFDTTTNILTVRWSIDRSGLENQRLQAAICFSVDSYPESGPNVGDSIIENINFNSENITNVIWNESKSFGTTYYISMFMRKENAAWSKSAVAAKSTVLIPQAKWESITFFNPDQDSIYVLNRSILVRKGKNWNSSSIPSNDQVLQDTLPESPKGFIRIGNPFRFKKGEGTPDVEMGVGYGTIPDGYSSKDIYLYVYKNNGWYAEPRIVVDSVSKMIFSNFPIDSAVYRKNVHLLMIDIAVPEVEISYDSTPVEAGKEFIYPITVKDNISNVVCSLKCGTIDQSPVLTKVITLNDTVYIGVLDINNYVNSNSYRVLLKVSDYKHSTTYDLSRQVKVEKNSISAVEGKWIPISTTSVLDDPTIEHAFLGICDGPEWKYDSTRFRIFNWYTAVDGGKTGYIQYSNDKSDIFNVVPGKVFWVKRRGDGAFDLGSGKTVSIKEPFRVKLPAGQWTDFCMPFQISVSLADIFSVSKLSNEIEDSLWFFEFVSDGSKLEFNTVYYPVLRPDQSKSDITLSHTIGHAYTIYNASGKDVELVIPPIDISYSMGNGTFQKRSQENGWFLKIDSKAENEITVPVYCVFKQNGQGVTKLPSPPYPGNVQVGLLDSVTNKTYGTYVFNKPEVGYSIPLCFSNSSGTESKTISYSVTRSNPEYAASCVFYNPENGKLEPVSASNLSVTLGPREHAYRWALVGDSSYFSSWMSKFVNVQFGLTKVSGIAGTILGIEYTVPYSGVSVVKVMVVNQLGQCIWSKVNRNLVPGKINSSSWDIKNSNKLAAGAYIIQVSAYNAAQRQVHRVQSKYLHLR